MIADIVSSPAEGILYGVLVIWMLVVAIPND